MRFSIRLSKLHRYFIYAIWWILAASGLYFAYMQDWAMREPTDMIVNVLKIHGICAAIALVLFGTLLNVHIPLSLKRRRNLKTGIPLLAIFFTLCMTGTGLYYSSQAWHDMIKWSHIWLGVVVCVVFPLHIVVGRYLKK